MSDRVLSNAENNNNQPDHPQGFLGDLTDGRGEGDWKSRYSVEAQKEIAWDKRYLIFLFAFSLTAPFIVGMFLKYSPYCANENFANCRKYIFSWFGGTLGGTLFAAKWLVHSVAKNTWNIDRRLWRIFTPHLSGGLALVIIILVNAGMFSDSNSTSLSIHKCYSIGFLVGYFSDNAIGKLTELAQVFFGSSLSQKK